MESTSSPDGALLDRPEPSPPLTRPEAAVPRSRGPSLDHGDRLALHMLQLGAVAIVVAATPYKVFELDRFFAPKELVLHLTAAVAGWWALAAPRDETAAPQPSTRRTLVDLGLALYLALSALSAALASNRWLAFRALLITVSGATVFWIARALTRRGLGAGVLAAAAVGTAVAAGSALLQAYGADSELFSLNRAPGGTFGNRNFVAHLSALGIPLLIGVGLRARHGAGTLLAGAGLAAVTAMLVLSRTRAAWLAVIASAAPLLLGLWRARRLAGGTTAVPPGRIGILALCCAVGAWAALTLPNTLRWRSDSPYLDSVKRVVDYKGGSGGGRLKQWRNSVRMLGEDPLLGVGPGNWAVRYPRHAPRDDPSLASDGMTANPWPSSDWIAVVSERGVAILPLAGALTVIAWWAHLAVWRRPDAQGALAGGILGSALTAVAVVGLFDAVLLLAAPTLLFWSAAGVLTEQCLGAAKPESDSQRWGRRTSVGARHLAGAVLAGVAAVGAGRSATQWGAMALFNTGRPGSLAAAGQLDPGSYRIHVRLAELAARRGRCAEARAHAGAAQRLFPEAPAPRRLLARCGRRGR